MRLAAKAASEAERDVYLSIAEGWRTRAAEASRSERRSRDEPRFDPNHSEGYGDARGH